MKDQIGISQIVQSKPHIISRKEKNCHLLVNRENGVVLVINDLGLGIWKIMAEKIRVKEIVAKLMNKYNVEFEDSKRETIKFINELVKNNFLYVNSHE